jgi:hypothetical protein
MLNSHSSICTDWPLNRYSAQQQTFFSKANFKAKIGVLRLAEKQYGIAKRRK